jgi:acetyl-CoA carboxylase biotin carboxyl carrier protein
MDFKEIQELLKFVSKSDLTDVLIEQEGFKLRIQRRQPDQIFYGGGPAAAPQAPYAAPAIAAAPAAPVAEAVKVEAPAAAENVAYITAPLPGTWYDKPSPDKPPYIKVGDHVSKGQVVGIIVAMKINNNVESEISGTVVEILVPNATAVDYGTKLIKVQVS